MILKIIKCFLNTKNKNATQKIKNKLFSDIQKFFPDEKISIEMDNDIIYFSISEERVDWNEIIFSNISALQKLAYGWTITGDIESTLDLFSDKTRYSGVIAIHFYLV